MQVPRGTCRPRGSSLKPPVLVQQGLLELGLMVSPRQIQALTGLAELVTAWSGRINLTGHGDLESVVRQLVLASAALLPLVPEDATRVVDLGSGAGFPGLPIAVLRPSCTVTLVEARARRHHFQRHAVRELGLANAVPRLGRADEIEPTPHDVAIAQAVGPPAEVMAWMPRWLRAGGLAIVPGRRASVQQPAGFTNVRVLHYQVPLGGPRHVAWTARRA